MAENAPPQGEDEIIQTYFAPLAAGFPGAFGLTDDCALLSPEKGHDLVVTTDAVVESVHFPPGTEPFAIGWKALAVNVSDLAAKGAKPLAYVMALALPASPTDAWLTAFTSGLAEAQRQFGCRLAGGDTDRAPGPISVTITAFGAVPKGALVRRSTASAGDLVYVTGVIGDACLGLRLRQDPSLAGAWGLDADDREYLIGQYLLPNRRGSTSAGFADILRAYATAAIDVSDGLVKDFHHLCQASKVAGRLNGAQVPISEAARRVLHAHGAAVTDLMTGGEDYQILLTVPPARAEAFERAARAYGTKVGRIGATGDGTGVVVFDADGTPLELSRMGWDHFDRPA